MESDERKLAELERKLQSLVEMQARRTRTARRWIRGAAGVLALCALGFAARGLAASGSCPNALPFCFQEQTPARASEVNENFAALVAWLEQKVGPVGDGAVVATRVTANELTGAVVRANELHTGSVQATGTLSAAGVQTGNIEAAGLVRAQELVANSLTAQNVRATSYLVAPTIQATQLMRLPMLASPPVQCNTDTLGFMYFDTQRAPGAAGNDWQLPCVCIYYAGYGPRWRQFDNVDAACL